jgi:hypothetical protein
MWKDDFSADKHQIVDADSGPVSSTAITTANAQLGTHLPRVVKEQPYLLALLDPAATAGCV